MDFMEYQKGYVKALIDISNLLERQESFLKAQKINQTAMARKIIKYCLENVDESMMYGDRIEFCYRINDTGRNNVERTEIVSLKSKS